MQGIFSKNFDFNGRFKNEIDDNKFLLITEKRPIVFTETTHQPASEIFISYENAFGFEKCWVDLLNLGCF